MAMNPMQRKANNSFLLGILITLLITGLIIAFLIYQVSQLNAELEEKASHIVYGYVVATQIPSGTEITPDMITASELNIATDTSGIIPAQTTNPETGDPAPDTAGTLFPVGKFAKVDLNPGTVITNDIVYEEEPLTDDVRSQEYNVVILPSQLQTGEYIDIRLRTPEGRDLIVASHKQVTIPNMGVDSTNCIWIDLSEEEILMMSCAIVESYEMNGAKLYATRYVEPGLQAAATPTYVPNDETRALIERDPNIVEEAKNQLLQTLNNNSALVRPGVENATSNKFTRNRNSY